MRKLFIILFFISLMNGSLFADEKQMISLAEKYYRSGEYYSAITEATRYQFFYPGGEYFTKSMLVMGKSYYRGDNYALASYTFSDLFKKFPSTDEGEESLFLLGNLRLTRGSPFYALRTFQEYQYVYKKGKFNERVELNICYAKTLSTKLDDALDSVKYYKKTFPETVYSNEIFILEKSIIDEINRPRKSKFIAAVGSAVIPGFGHFYTGNYKLGFLSFVSNALFIYLIYNRVVAHDTFGIVFFSAVELTFYQNSITGGINSVNEYNSRNGFYKKIRLSIGQVDF